MTLKDKFELVSHWFYFEEKRKKAPETEMRALIQTALPVKEWPAGVRNDSHLALGNGKHLYTIRAKTEDFEKFCSQPNVLKLTL